MSIKEGFLIINGERIKKTDNEIKVSNPATEELMGIVPIADKLLVSKAIESARSSFTEWSNKSPKERSDILHKIAQIIKDRVDIIAETLTLEMGKPLKDAKREILVAVEVVEFYAIEATRIKGINYWLDSHDNKSQAIYQPLGVIAAISPFNYPVSLTSFMVAPALAAGNTVVVKPSSKTPLSVNLFMDCFLVDDLPKGVVNFIAGPGGWLVESPLIDKVAFTGSTETGKKIGSICGGNVKRMTLELGGNSPIIIFKDTEIQKAAKDAAKRSFRNMGQVCNSINRIYVEKSIEKDFINYLIQETKKFVIGNGLENPDVDLGPMVSREGLEKVREHLKDAISKGAKLEYGGKVPEGFRKGYFFEPTIISNVNHSMKVMTEETFGPVAPVMSFSTTDEAIKLANDTAYGLVCYAYTNDLAKAIDIAEKLQYGTVNINSVEAGQVGYPYGGWKESGIGVELSEHALYEYLNVKHIKIKIR